MSKYSRRLFWLSLLVLVCMLFIFSNSLKNGEESKMDSDFFTKIAEKIFNKLMPGNTVDWNYVVRKAAHLFEFFVLGLSSALLTTQINKKRSITLSITFLYVSIVAVADEFIQRFTGRSSKLSDVMIDITGSILGITFILLLEFIVHHTKQSKQFSNKYN